MQQTECAINALVQGNQNSEESEGHGHEFDVWNDQDKDTGSLMLQKTEQSFAKLLDY